MDWMLIQHRLNSNHGRRWQEDVKLESTFRTKDLVNKLLNLQIRRLQ